jgi:hypothetical protein
MAIATNLVIPNLVFIDVLKKNKRHFTFKNKKLKKLKKLKSKVRKNRPFLIRTDKYYFDFGRRLVLGAPIFFLGRRAKKKCGAF